MPEPVPVTMSAVLAAEEALSARRLAGEQILSLASGEIGLSVLPTLSEQLAQAADRNDHGPVAGSPTLRTAATGYFARRNLATDHDLVVCGPGSKALQFALLLAVGGDVVVPVPGWASYAAQAQLAGACPIPVPILPGEGGVPDPAALREAVARARGAGRNPRCVVTTLPDNPTGTIATVRTVRCLAQAARDLDLVIVSDEIYGDLVFDGAERPVSPAAFAPERTVVTTGISKNLALGGWRLGVARLPDSPLGRQVHTRLVGIAGHIWTSTASPQQAAAAYVFQEPPEVVAHIAASRRLHEAVANAVAKQFTAVGAELWPVRATCYLYPDFEPLRDHLARTHQVHGSTDFAALLAQRYGIGLLPGAVFGEPENSLRMRACTGRLYGETGTEHATALAAEDPTQVPWIKRSLDRIGEAMADLVAPNVPAVGPRPDARVPGGR